MAFKPDGRAVSGLLLSSDKTPRATNLLDRKELLQSFLQDIYLGIPIHIRSFPPSLL